MHRAAVLAILAAGSAGCRGILGIDDPVVGDDAPSDVMPTDTGSGSDTPAAPTCLGKWRDGSVVLGAATPVLDTSLAKEQYSPWVSEDGLELWFSGLVAQDRDGILVATRISTSAMFTSPQERTDLDGGTATYDIALTPDKLTAVVDKDNNHYDLFLATRATATGTFSTPSASLLGAVNTSDQEVDSYLSADSLRIYFSRVPQNGGNAGIFLSTRATTTAAFGSPTQLTFGSGNSDSTPGFSLDETVIVFSRDLPNNTFGLFYASRPDISASFGTEIAVPITASGQDDGPFLSADTCTLYYRRNNGDGSVQILAAHVVL